MRTRSRQLTRTIAILASALSLAGCGRELATAPKASANVILTGAALVVEGSSFSLLGFDHGFRGEIPYRFTNVSDQPVSLLNCLGGYGVWLERKEGAAWQTGYAGIRLGCLSPPIVIAPGEQLADTLRIHAGQAGSNFFPQFRTPDPAGTYRLVIGSAYWNYTHDGPSWGDEIPAELRTSAEFQLRVE